MRKKYCLICLKNKFKKLFSKNFKLKFVYCSNCEFIFQKQYDENFGKKFYSRRIYYTVKNPNAHSLVKRFKDIYKEIKFISSSKKISILDYGCGNGSFLNFLEKKNFSNLTGYEIYLKPYKNRSINIINTLKKKKFDVVILNHVLEHVINPLQVIKNIKQNILKKDGHIIIEVPDFSIYEENGIKPGLFVKEHYSQFTLKSLFNLSMQARMHLFKSSSIDCNLKSRDPFIPSILVILKNNQNLVHSIDYFKKRFNLKEKFILKQFKKIQSKKISLFGCGDGMEYLLSIINSKNIRFLIDNNKMLEGSFFRGKKISGPTIISKLSANDIVFITALNIKNVLTIKKQIRRLNKQVKILS